MGLKVNFTQTEAASEARSVEVLPAGEYHCNIVSVEVRTVNPSSPNAGKPFWNMRFVVQDGKYEGSTVFANVMLFEGKDGTLGLLAQLMKSLGHNVNAGEFELPEGEDLEGKSVTVVGYKQAAKKNPKTGEMQAERFNVSGFRTWDGNSAPKSGNNSLLP